MDISLAGKVALITGAGPNIGSGIALALSRYGAKVACNDLELEAAKAAVRRIERNGGTGMALSGDVSVEGDVLANLAERSEDIDVESAKADLKRAEEQVYKPESGVEPSVALDAMALAQARIDAAK